MLLTSGQQPTAEQGIPLLRELVKQAQGRIIIMPGAGVNPENAARILKETCATEIHSSARRADASGLKHTHHEVVNAIVKQINAI